MQCDINVASLNLSFQGKSLEIVLSPAVKKPKSRVSPPTSPSAPTQVLEWPPVELPVLTLLNQESIEQKLKEAEERKKIIETDRWEHVEASSLEVQEYKKFLLISGSRTWRISWQRSTLPSRRGRKARKPRFGLSFSPFGGPLEKQLLLLKWYSSF